VALDILVGGCFRAYELGIVATWETPGQVILRSRISGLIVTVSRMLGRCAALAPCFRQAEDRSIVHRQVLPWSFGHQYPTQGGYQMPHRTSLQRCRLRTLFVVIPSLRSRPKSEHARSEEPVSRCAGLLASMLYIKTRSPETKSLARL